MRVFRDIELVDLCLQSVQFVEGAFDLFPSEVFGLGLLRRELHNELNKIS